MQGLALCSGRRPGLGHSGLNSRDLVQELVQSKAEGVQRGPSDLRQVRLGLDHSTCFPVAPPRRLWLKRHPLFSFCPSISLCQDWLGVCCAGWKV